MFDGCCSIVERGCFGCVAVIGEAYVYPASGFFLSIGCALIQKWSWIMAHCCSGMLHLHRGASISPRWWANRISLNNWCGSFRDKLELVVLRWQEQIRRVAPCIYTNSTGSRLSVLFSLVEKYRQKGSLTPSNRHIGRPIPWEINPSNSKISDT